MGCDIHTYLEVKVYKDEQRTNGVWANQDLWIRNTDRDRYPEFNDERKYEISDELWGSRWYYLFAVLAGVRNAWDITPISEPKGFPDDAGEETIEMYNHWSSDAHSSSWLTLKELTEWSGWEEIDHPVDDKRTRREILEEFHEKTIARMKSHLKEHHFKQYEIRPEDIRMVFWFDN